jgi:hypothetical protein
MDLEEQKLPQKKKQLNNYAKYSSMAFQMMIIIIIGSLGGLKLDKWIGTEFPFFTLILSLVSVAIAIYMAIKDIIRFNK